MKQLLLIAGLLLLLSLSASAQNPPAWKWAKSDTSIRFGTNPSYLKAVIGVRGNKALWGYIKNKYSSYGLSAYGDYALREYDTTGAITTSTAITGKVSLTTIKADSAGNWYILASVYDTMRFAGGAVFTTNIFANESMNYLFKLHAGTLALDWCQKIGTNYQTSVDCLEESRSRLYLVTDSGLIGRFFTVDMATGNRSLLLSQSGNSRISSLQADNAGNLYVAGSCASVFSGINFNGTMSIPPGTNQYPSYIVRYRSNGQHDWHIWMTDNTCVPRKLSLATSNLLYYSGAVHDTMKLGGVQLHKPAWVFNMMLARLDSTGAVAWVRQLKDTLGGDASLEHTPHAVVSADSSVTLFPNARGYMDWGGGITTNSGVAALGICVHYNAAGNLLWVKTVSGQTTTAQQIAGNGTDVWVTGVGRDSFSYKFDAVTAPASLNYPPYLARLYTGAKTATPPNNPTSVTHATGRLPLTVQPNPVTDELTVRGMPDDGAPVRISLTDMTGRSVYAHTMTGGSGTVHIGVSDFPRGVYVLQVKGADTQYTGQVVLR